MKCEYIEKSLIGHRFLCKGGLRSNYKDDYECDCKDNLHIDSEIFVCGWIKRGSPKNKIKWTNKVTGITGTSVAWPDIIALRKCDYANDNFNNAIHEII